MKILSEIIPKIKGFSRKTLMIVLAVAVLVVVGTIGYQVIQNNTYNKYFTTYQQKYNEENYEEAGQALTNANAIKPVENYSEKLDECDILRVSLNAYNNGIKAFDEKNYISALGFFKLVRNEDEKHIKLAEAKIKECDPLVRSQAIEKSKTLASKGDYAGAIKTLNDYKDNSEVSSLITQYQNLQTHAEEMAKQEELARQQAEERARQEALAQEKAKKKSEGVRIGMTQQDVLDSCWGKPQKVNRTVTQYGTHEQWVYPNYNYLYFDDGILTSIQN